MPVTVGSPPLAVTGSLRTVTGNVAPNTAFTVQDAVTFAPVTIYSDPTMATPIVSPVTTRTGDYLFYVPTGTYIIVVADPKVDDSQSFQVFNSAGSSGGGGGASIPLTLIDAKGDLPAGSAADTVVRLAVGTNGQALTADSTQTSGLKWSTIAGVGGAATSLSTTYLPGQEPVVISVTPLNVGNGGTETQGALGPWQYVFGGSVFSGNNFDSVCQWGYNVKNAQASQWQWWDQWEASYYPGASTYLQGERFSEWVSPDGSIQARFGLAAGMTWDFTTSTPLLAMAIYANLFEFSSVPNAIGTFTDPLDEWRVSLSDGRIGTTPSKRSQFIRHELNGHSAQASGTSATSLYLGWGDPAIGDGSGFLFELPSADEARFNIHNVRGWVMTKATTAGEDRVNAQLFRGQLEVKQAEQLERGLRVVASTGISFYPAFEVVKSTGAVMLTAFVYTGGVSTVLVGNATNFVVLGASGGAGNRGVGTAWMGRRTTAPDYSSGELGGEGVEVWVDATDHLQVWGATKWNFTRQAAIADPTGGVVVDIECRAAVADLLTKLETIGALTP